MKISSLVTATNNTLRAAIGSMLSARPELPVRVVDIPPGDRVLVLAPHPDDETIGCGGTIKKYIDAGKHVDVVILCDGRHGDPEVRAIRDPALRAERERALVALRRQEALTATRALGVTELTLLGAHDGHLSAANVPLLEALLRHFEAVRPDIVFVPFFLDRHHDHIAANACLEAICGRLAWTKNMTCAAYEIWSPLVANTLVDISAEATSKWQAIAAYKSQLKDVDYLNGTQGLNRFRAVAGLLPDGAYAEAFFVSPIRTYLDLYRQYQNG